MDSLLCMNYNIETSHLLLLLELGKLEVPWIKRVVLVQ